MPSTEENDDRWLGSEESSCSLAPLPTPCVSTYSGIPKWIIKQNMPESPVLADFDNDELPRIRRTLATPNGSVKELQLIKGPKLDQGTVAGSNNCRNSFGEPSGKSHYLKPYECKKVDISKNNTDKCSTPCDAQYNNGEQCAMDDRNRKCVPGNSTCSTRTSVSSNKLFLKVDELTEAVERSCEYKPIYGTCKDRRSRYSQIYEGASESAEQRSRKITEECKVDIKKMHEVVNCLFCKLEEAMDRLVCRDFSICEDIIDLIQEFQHCLCSLITHLRYSPYQCELEEMNNLMICLINDLEMSPPYVLLRIVEFGYYLYEIGNHLREDLLPSSFAHLIHALQIRLYRLHTGRVIRQIYFVPTSFDPVLSTYAKSHRAMRVEAFCHCRIVLLPPCDPRAVYCPPGRRTIEVNFDEHKGRFLGFANVLSRMCPIPQENAVRLVATVFRRFSGYEIEMTNSEVVEMNASEPRLRYCEIQSDLYLGTGLATAPHIANC